MGKKSLRYVDIPGAAVERTFVSSPAMGPPRPRRHQLPLMEISGSRKGPTLCVTAGIHGCEYAAIAAAIKVYEGIDADDLAGRILIVPVVNTAAFWTRTPYVNPDDGLDIGATYGVAGSSISYRIGEYLTEELYRHADYLLDLHGGDLMEAILPHAGFTRTGDSVIDQSAEQLARSYGTEVVFERLERGAFEQSGVAIPRVIAEAGGEGQLLQECVDIHVRGVMNILKSTKMLRGTPEVPSRQTLFHGRYEVYVQCSGLFTSDARVGDPVAPGQRLGVIKGLDGNVCEEVAARDGGACLLVMTNPVKLAGDLAYKILLE